MLSTAVMHVLLTLTCVLFSHLIHKDGLAYMRNKGVKWRKGPLGVKPLSPSSPLSLRLDKIHTSSFLLWGVYSSLIKHSFLWIVTHSSQLSILCSQTQLNTQGQSLRKALLCYYFCKTPNKENATKPNQRQRSE